MPHKNMLPASKKLNKILSAVKNNLFCLEILWCRTVYEDAEIANTAPHSHSFYELHLCLESGNSFIINDEIMQLKKGSFLLLSPKTEHIVCPYEKGYSELVLAFDFSDESNIKDYLKSNSMPFYIDTATDFMMSSVHQMLNHIIEEKYGCNEYVLNLASCFFIDLFANIAKKLENPPASYAKENDDRIKIAKKYIEDNIDKKILTEDIANQVNVSTRHLNRLVKSAENTSVGELVRRIRIKRAKKLLMTTQKSLSEIAYETGFGSSFHFNKTFKRIEGITPGTYRNYINK